MLWLCACQYEELHSVSEKLFHFCRLDLKGGKVPKESKMSRASHLKMTLLWTYQCYVG